ncbi:MAG TPA: glycoside hydrolase 100 family protein [bacterium]|nr:glycoside hydrolase 100 family protein [bacterium]
MINKNLLGEAYQQAIDALKHCINQNSLYASGTPNGYLATWSRDLNIAMLGGSLVAKDFQEVFKKSLCLLTDNQPISGQIPNCVGDFNTDRNSIVTFTTIDSSLWFIIGEYVYKQAYHDATLFKKHESAINKTWFWLTCQDTGEDHLPEQHPTSDWQDAFPHKYGHCLSTQALYYAALKMAGKNNEALLVKKIVNGQGRPDLKMFDDERGYYLPYVWKNHDGDHEKGHWFDTQGNLLAIMTGLADKHQTEKILNYIEKNKINKPYPVKAIYPALKKGDKEWFSYFEKCNAKDPYQYLNGGIWPYLGAFYVAALIKAKKNAKAQKELANLTLANQIGREREWEFNEWLDGLTGKPKGAVYQAWSAGAYIFANACVQRKKIIYF